MPLYKYTARDMDAKKITGTKEMVDSHELALFLRTQDLYLIDCQETQEIQNSYKLNVKELADFSRQIGAMIGSGVSLIRAIAIMIQREEKPKLKALYTDIYRKLQQGQSLSSAMEDQGKAFSLLMINMYRTSETTGQMEKVAHTMAEQYDKEGRIQAKVKNAMIYPIILLCVTLLVILLVFTVIIPNFEILFDGRELPLVTVIVKGLSDVMLNHWYLIFIGICLVILGFGILLQKPIYRKRFDHFKLKAPMFGKLYKTIYTSRFARNMCSLYTSGISIINGLNIVKANIGNTYIEEQFDVAIRMVKNGATLSQCIQSIDGFDSKLASSIYIGEESGKLDMMLTSLADEFDYEAEGASQRMVTILEPVMIIALAVIVLVVMLAVLLPIFQIYQDPSGLR